ARLPVPEQPDQPVTARRAPRHERPRSVRPKPGRGRRVVMTMTDPVADLLTRLRNANSAYHDTVTLPHSKLKGHIADILKAEGYIADWSVGDARVGQTLTLSLKYGPNRERSIAGIKRVSKPGLRVYAKSTEIPK